MGCCRGRLNEQLLWLEPPRSVAREGASGIGASFPFPLALV
jgi:hypothetical protein